MNRSRDKQLSGPWHVDADIGHRIMGGAPGEFNRREIANVPSYVPYAEDVRALIAAAPQMVDALREAYAALAPMILPPSCDVKAARALGSIREALAKALPTETAEFANAGPVTCKGSTTG